jgi:hypothetical protein
MGGPLARLNGTLLMIKDKVFISYSNKDKALLASLLMMLKPHIRNGLHPWSDQQISPGQDWREEIQKALNTAKVAVFLVTADFLGSDSIDQEELRPLLASAKRKETTILWIPADHCCVEASPIYEYQPLIPPDKPLKDFSRSKRNRLIKEIAENIKDAWQAPSWAPNLPVDADSEAATLQLRDLSEKYTDLPPEALTSCFQRAVEDRHGPNSLRNHFPQLAALQTIDWPTLNDLLGSSWKPTTALVSALARHLGSLQQENDEPEIHQKEQKPTATFLAFVLRWAGASARGKNYYAWKAYVYSSTATGYETIDLGNLELELQQLVFDKPGGNEVTIAAVLGKLIAWARVHTSLPILEIFVPVSLLDVAWSDQVVAVVEDDPITLLEAIPYLLRPVDRLEDDFNSTRPRLISKMQCLSEGKGTWCTGDSILNLKYMRGSLVEDDQVVGIKRCQPFPSDVKERARWFRALLDSMVPIALWWRHESHPLTEDWQGQLDSYPMLGGHHDGAPVSPACHLHNELACQRKRLLMHPLASQLVLMLDHGERAPKITPRQRGATRAVSPSTK